MVIKQCVNFQSNISKEFETNMGETETLTLLCSECIDKYKKEPKLLSNACQSYFQYFIYGCYDSNAKCQVSKQYVHGH